MYRIILSPKKQKGLWSADLREDQVTLSSAKASEIVDNRCLLWLTLSWLPLLKVSLAWEPEGKNTSLCERKHLLILKLLHGRSSFWFFHPPWQLSVSQSHGVGVWAGIFTKVINNWEMHKQHLRAVRCKTLWAVILLLGFLAEIKHSVSFALCIFQSSLATDSAVGKTCSCVGSLLCNFNDFIRKCNYLNNYKGLSLILTSTNKKRTCQ